MVAGERAKLNSDCGCGVFMVAAFLVCELPDSNTSDRGDWFSVYCRHESCRPFPLLFSKGSGFLAGCCDCGKFAARGTGKETRD